jgi:hypothetical protein
MPEMGYRNPRTQIATSMREKYRAGGIRTHDLLNPIQAHYQAVLRPAMSAGTIDCGSHAGQ